MLASNSNQQRPINTPQPFRHTKALGENKYDFVPKVQPTNNADFKESDRVGEVHRTENINTKSIPTAAPPVDKSVMTDANSDDGDIVINLRALRNLVTDFMEIESDFREGAIQKRAADGRAITDYLFDGRIIGRIQKFVEKYIFPVAQSEALQSLVPTGARLFLFKGMPTSFASQKDKKRNR